MTSNLPMKKEKGIWNKIKKFITGIFNKKKHIVVGEEIIKETTSVKKAETKDNNIFAEMHQKAEQEKVKSELIEMVRKNPDLVYSLSLEQLESLDLWFEDIIKKNDMKIKALEKKLA